MEEIESIPEKSDRSLFWTLLAIRVMGFGFVIGYFATQNVPFKFYLIGFITIYVVYMTWRSWKA